MSKNETLIEAVLTGREPAIHKDEKETEKVTVGENNDLRKTSPPS